ncbi:MAG: hypothetical protein AAFR61_11070 [Bacteroidota bacterium]
MEHKPYIFPLLIESFFLQMKRKRTPIFFQAQKQKLVKSMSYKHPSRRLIGQEGTLCRNPFSGLFYVRVKSQIFLFKTDKDSRPLEVNDQVVVTEALLSNVLVVRFKARPAA